MMQGCAPRVQRRSVASLVITGVLLLAGCATSTQRDALPGRPTGQADVLRDVSAYVEQARTDWGIAGMAVAIVRDDSVIYARGFGVRTEGQSEPVDVNTLFAIGSNTKAFTAAAIGTLVDDGSMSWDDAVTEHLPEFLLRVRALLRRAPGTQVDELRFAGHLVDLRRWSARLVDGRQARLSEREIGILRLLAERRGEVVSRDEIMDRVWGDATFPSTRGIDNFIVRLRRLFEPDPAAPVHFHTVWGVGYRFTPEPVRDSSHSRGEEA